MRNSQYTKRNYWKKRDSKELLRILKFSSDDEEVESTHVKKNKVVKKSNRDLNFDDSQEDSEENSDFESDKLRKVVQQIAVQNVATNYLNKKGTLLHYHQ